MFDKLALLGFNYLSDAHIRFYSDKLGKDNQIGFSDIRYLYGKLNVTPDKLPMLVIRKDEKNYNIDL